MGLLDANIKLSSNKVSKPHDDEAFPALAVDIGGLAQCEQQPEQLFDYCSFFPVFFPFLLFFSESIVRKKKHSCEACIQLKLCTITSR